MRTSSSRRQWSVVAAIAAVAIALSLPQAPVAAADDAPQVDRPRVEVSAPVTPFVFDGDVRDLPSDRAWRPGDPIREIPRRSYFRPGQELPVDVVEGEDPLLEAQRAAARVTDPQFVTPDRNYPGQGFSGVNPPDTVGDVGPNHYIQMINSSGGATVVIYDKAVPTPNQLASFALDSLGSGSCAGGLGDPIVLYDRLADRWVLTEFSSSGNNICIYVSQTPDPVAGGWFAYGFASPSFPDYPKYGVWPTDANGGMGSYVYTTNESSSGVYAVERAKMLVGDPTTFQRFTIPDLPGFPFNAVTPADLDGTEPPPAGAPAVIMRQRDTEVHSGPTVPEPGDVLEQWHFDVDWITTANTTLTKQDDINVADFSSELCGLSAFACFEQPGTSTTLDPLREVIMNRLQYRNMGDHEVLVGNFVTDVDGNERGGLRWFELRRDALGNPWTLFQEGTFAPEGDADSRWMAASSMDQSGNIAIAYNVSSSVTFPSLRYTGRMAEDPPGTMSQPETSIREGTASNSSNRYGDYSAMNVDPSDDCTFWFTGMNNESSNWRTQIASFRFAACGCDLFPLPLTLAGGPIADNLVELAWNDSELATVVEYRVRRSRTMGGPYQTIATVADTSMGVGNGPGYVYQDDTVSGGITYYYVVQASDGGACTSDASNEIEAPVEGICLLAPLFDGAQSVSTPNSLVCSLTVEWDPGVDECGGPLVYDVFRSTDPAFEPLEGNRVAAQLSGTSYLDADQLVDGLTYYYIVRAIDTFNGVSETNTVRVSAEPAGEVAPPAFVDDGGDTGPAQLVPGASWAIDPTAGNFGPGAYRIGSYPNNTCTHLTSPAIQLGIGNMLEFWSSFDIEPGWDKGEVQISTDGGANWARLELNYPANSTRTSDECGFPAGDYFTGSGTPWAKYTADLSAYDGLEVMLRWSFSTDTSVNRALGWVIDDIAVVTAPDACATASACDDNPIVNVLPNGPIDACALSIPELSVDTTGGSGMFSYQWLRNGAVIPGADGTTYQPTEAGAYNVQVQAATCEDAVTDGQSTSIGVESAPRFNGVQAALDTGGATCGIDVVWNEATSVCPGPISYAVYRSTGPGVTADPAYLRAVLPAGTTGYADTAGLADVDDYHYLVQAIEGSTGDADGNAVVAVASPSGPDIVSFSDDAGDSAAAQLTTTSPWTVEPTGGNAGPGVYTTGQYPNDVCADVRTPSIPIGSDSTLSFWSAGDIENSYDKGEVQISTDGGTSWARLEVGYPGTSTNSSDQCGLGTGDYFTGNLPDWSEYTADLSAYAGQSAILRWEFSTDGSVNRSGWLVDDISVFTASTCETAAAGPAPAGDGRNGSAPLIGDRLTDDGSTIQVTFDATCGASDYNLIYGDLADVGTLALAGSECGLGTGGTFQWNGVPGGDLFWLVVGTDGAGVESSWGVDAAGFERNGGASSGECGVSSKDLSGACP